MGTYTPTGLTANTPANLFMGSDNKLYYPSADNYNVNTFRAYFLVDLGDGLGKANVQFADIPEIVLNFDDSDTELTIDSRTATSLPLTEGAVYSIDGRRLCSTADFYSQLARQTMPRGVYVIRSANDTNQDKTGRKVVVK